MKTKHYARLVGGLVAGGAAIAAASYATYAGITWYRYGRTEHQVSGGESDSLVDLYMPEYEVVDRHHIRVAAPAAITFAAACEMTLSQSPIVRAIFRTRELALGCFSCAASIAKRELPACCHASSSQQNEISQQKGFLAELKTQGWGVLAEVPGHEIVLGTVTQPWAAKPVFRAVPPDEFAAFHDPGYVKIVFTLRADPLNSSASMARTETRVATTDPVARAKFRRYWSLVSPGVILIRRTLLRSLKVEAERRTRESEPEYETAEFGRYAEP
jgi:hypothetical protein